MNIQARGIMRQLTYALRMAEKLSEMLLECDDEVFDPVASEIASGLVNRIKIAGDILNSENKANKQALN